MRWSMASRADERRRSVSSVMHMPSTPHAAWDAPSPSRSLYLPVLQAVQPDLQTLPDLRRLIAQGDPEIRAMCTADARAAASRDAMGARGQQLTFDQHMERLELAYANMLVCCCPWLLSMGGTAMR